MRFDGETYDPGKDKNRLTAQIEAVFDAMKDGEWTTLAALESKLNFPQASVSARIRDFRKDRFGAHTVERRRVEDVRGTHEYRLIVNPLSGGLFPTPAAVRQAELFQDSQEEA